MALYAEEPLPAKCITKNLDDYKLIELVRNMIIQKFYKGQNSFTSEMKII